MRTPEHHFGIVAATAAGVAVGGTWAGAQTASIASSGAPFGAPPAVVLRAIVRLGPHLGDPADAWPPRIAARLPGPVGYWTATILAGAVALTLGMLVARQVQRLSGSQRRRFGVDTSARLAKPRDLRGLIVRGGVPNRFILGRVGRHLVATEHNDPARRVRRAGRLNVRRGDRSSVAIIGPTRCGKTAATIGGILEWSGPAILSSVKSDLMAATIAWRRTRGEVRVFDPTHSTHERTRGWSPLRGAATISGAQKATRALIDAGPRQGAENLDFFLRLAEQLLWPHLYLAARNGHTMREVVRWITTQESLEDPDTELGALLRSELQAPDTARQEAARDIDDTLRGLWSLDRRTRSSAYATAQTLLGAWHDPGVVAASEYEEIDLEWLLAGENTLYICGPLHEQARLAPVFGGLLGDLINQAYERANLTDTPLPTTLLVLDEAANTPTRWLPHVASTCAGIGLLLVTVWQSKAQLDAAYGRLADSVLTNHGTKILFSGISDVPTLEYAARLVGDEEILRRTTTHDRNDGHSSLSVSSHTVPLLPAHVLRQTRPGNALLVHGTLPPAHLKSRPYYRDRSLRARAHA